MARIFMTMLTPKAGATAEDVLSIVQQIRSRFSGARVAPVGAQIRVLLSLHAWIEDGVEDEFLVGLRNQRAIRYWTPPRELVQ